MTTDPITVMTTISLGLKLVDQFRDLALRFFGKNAQPPSATVEQTGNAIHVKQNGTVTNTVTGSQMHLDEWDEKRYHALERRVRSNWTLFNDLYAELPELPIDEKVRIKLRMDRMEEELCTDFREMVRIYQRTLGISLPDHYTLYEVCSS
ncbi:MAG TPA: hypothetical protein VMP08_22330 [Anaerolineae bacterium]|nr:hypothetical protein [Anaerolineae bacterium]